MKVMKQEHIKSHCEHCDCDLGHHLYSCPTLKKEVKLMARGINSFTGKNVWLSNFAISPVVLDGVVYDSVEHAYQAAKSLIPAERELIRKSGSPANAKRLGTKVPLRTDWNNVKLSIMEQLLRQKFAEGTELAEKLKNTNGDLIENNYWHDNFYGSCICEKCNDKGKNHLGKLLMTIRDELQK